jgi:hypothetical protein
LRMAMVVLSIFMVVCISHPSGVACFEFEAFCVGV